MMLTIPVVLPLVDNSWRWSLAVWGVPLVADRDPDRDPRTGAPRTPLRSSPAAGRSWWPDWSNKLIWQIGILFGSVNSVYFCSNAFLPGHLTEAGRPDLIGSALTALNFGQLPASFVLLAIAGRLERRAWPFVLCGAADAAVRRRHRRHRERWTIFFAGCARLSRRRSCSRWALRCRRC